MLGQSEVVKLLEKCNGDPTAIEEILSAYVVWKLLKGRSTAYVLVKLKDLCNLLKLTYVSYKVYYLSLDDRRFRAVANTKPSNLAGRLS